MLTEEISNDRPENFSYRGREMKTEGIARKETRPDALLNLDPMSYKGFKVGWKSLKAVGGG